MCVLADLLQRPLDVDALTPGGGRVGQALPSVAAARDVDALPSKVLKGRRHDADAVVGQSSGVLRRRASVGSNRKEVTDCILKTFYRCVQHVSYLLITHISPVKMKIAKLVPVYK